MKYFLYVKRPLGIEQSRHEVREVDFIEISRLVVCMGAFINITNRFDILVENLRDFEMTFYKHSIAMRIDRKTGGNNSYVEINQKFINFMASAEMFLDQLVVDISKDPVLSVKLSEIKAMISDVYDGSFEYRAMEALRNVAKHSMIPIGSVSQGSGPGRNKLREYRLYATISAQEILSDRKFKKSFKLELEQKNIKTLDVPVMARGYFSNLSRIMKKCFDILEDILTETKAAYVSKFGLYYEEFGQSPKNYILIGPEQSHADSGYHYPSGVENRIPENSRYYAELSHYASGYISLDGGRTIL